MATLGAAAASPSTTTTSADSDTSSGDTSSNDTSSGDTSSGSTAADDHTTTADTSSSTLPGFCGDGLLDPDEQCDDGLANDDLALCTLKCTLAACGDGHLFSAAEECDDANFDASDGCHLCRRSRKVFVTSAIYQGDEFLGIPGADQRCRSLAAQADLPNFATYKAWLSDSTTSPAERMFQGLGRYELVNGLLVADSWPDLLAHGPKIPIVVDEHSQTHETGVWTGTMPNGMPALGSDHCADWTDLDPGHTAFWGVNTETTADWTLADVDTNPGDCGAPLALLCFEQE